MSMPRVGIVHLPKAAASLQDVGRAAMGWCQPVFMLPGRTAPENPELAGLIARLYEMVVVEKDSMTATAATLDLAGITTFHDGWLESVDTVIRELKLPGMTIDFNPWDKFEQRQRLRAGGLTTVAAVAVDDADSFSEAIAAIGFPAVLKPRRGVSSAGVAFIRVHADVMYQLEQRRNWSGLLLESMIEKGLHPAGTGNLADFVSVETLNLDGRQIHATVVDKTPGTVLTRSGSDGADAVFLTGNLVPSRLEQDYQESICGYVSRCLTVLGVRWRVTHTEVKLTPRGPEIIEINGRVAGNIPRLLRAVGGRDLVADALHLALGHAPQDLSVVMQGFAASLHPAFASTDDLVKSTVTAAELRALPGVIGVDMVAAFGRPKADSDHRAAKVVVFANSVTDFDCDIAATLEGIDKLFAQDAVSCS